MMKNTLITEEEVYLDESECIEEVDFGEEEEDIEEEEEDIEEEDDIEDEEVEVTAVFDETRINERFQEVGEEDEEDVKIIEGDCLIEKIADFHEALDSLCCVAVHPLYPLVPHIAAGGCDEKCRIYEMSNEYVRDEFPLNSSPSVDERRRMSGSSSIVTTLTDASDTIVDAAYSYDGRYFATASYDGNVRIYSSSKSDDVLPSSSSSPSSSEFSYKLIFLLEGPSKDIEWVKWHRKGYALLAGCADGTSWLWWIPTGAVMAVFGGHGGRVSCGGFGCGGKVVATASEDGSFIVWNVRTGKAAHTIKFAPASSRENRGMMGEGKGVVASVGSLDLHFISPLAAAGCADGGSRLINVETGKILATLSGHSDSVEAIAFDDYKEGEMFDAFSPSSSVNTTVALATGGLDGIVKVWDCSRLVVRCDFRQRGRRRDEEDRGGEIDEDGGVSKLLWLRKNPNVLMSCSVGGYVCVWDCRSGKCEAAWKAHRDTVLDMMMVKEDERRTRIATTSDDRSLRIWDVFHSASMK